MEKGKLILFALVSALLILPIVFADCTPQWICSHRSNRRYCTDEGRAGLCDEVVDLNNCSIVYNGSLTADFGWVNCYGGYATFEDVGTGLGNMMDSTRQPVGMFILFMSLISVLVVFVLSLINVIRAFIRK